MLAIAMYSIIRPSTAATMWTESIITVLKACGSRQLVVLVKTDPCSYLYVAKLGV